MAAALRRREADGILLTRPSITPRPCLSASARCPLTHIAHVATPPPQQTHRKPTPPYACPGGLPRHSPTVGRSHASSNSTDPCDFCLRIHTPGASAIRPGTQAERAHTTTNLGKPTAEEEPRTMQHIPGDRQQRRTLVQYSRAQGLLCFLAGSHSHWLTRRCAFRSLDGFGGIVVSEPPEVSFFVFCLF